MIQIEFLVMIIDEIDYGVVLIIILHRFHAKKA